MKKLLLCLLVSYMAIAQPDVEVRLVNVNVGTPSCDYFLNDWLCNTTNDAGLNAILSNNGVNYFRIKGGHPYEPYTEKILSIQGTFPPQLITDLQAYSTVVAAARVSSTDSFSDTVNLQLINSNIGTPTGFNGSIVTTNDSGLNQIFLNFNVFYYVQSYPFSTVSASLRYYTAVCDCDRNLLAAALDSYTAVIEVTETVGGVFLSNNQVERPKTTISPNPFSENFNIETDQLITNYAIIDLTGKTIVLTASKNELDFKIEQLNSGLYILNLQFENGKTVNHKLVKK